MATVPIVDGDWLEAHRSVIVLTAATVGLFVIAKGLDVLGGPAGVRTPKFYDILAGLLGAFGVILVAITVTVAIVDLATQ